jgi:hypothetical protein
MQTATTVSLLIVILLTRIHRPDLNSWPIPVYHMTWRHGQYDRNAIENLLNNSK